MYGLQGVEVKRVGSKFRRDALTMYNRNLEIAEKHLVQNLFNQSTEEDEMANSNTIIEIAATGDVKKTEEILQSAIGQAVKRALWAAKRKDEFLAIPVLQELNAKYNPGGTQTTAVEIKDAKDVKLTKSGAVDDRVWSAILKKADKIGAVRKSSGNVAEISLPKKESDTFVKAVQAVKGITVG